MSRCFDLGCAGCEECCDDEDDGTVRPMAQSVAERQRAFKASMKAAGYVKLEAWVTKEQRDKFRQLGSDEWLRKRIDSARDPANLPQISEPTEGG